MRMRINRSIGSSASSSRGTQRTSWDEDPGQLARGTGFRARLADGRVELRLHRQ